MASATYPAYNKASNASAWFYGLAAGLANAGANIVIPSSATDEWLCATTPLNLQPGTYYLTEVGAHGYATITDNLNQVYFSILEDDSGDLAPVTLGNGSTYIDMTADVVRGAGNADLGPTTVASVSFTIESGKSYQMSWWLHGVATRASQTPAICRMNNGQGPQGLTCYATTGLTSGPVAHTGTPSASGELPRGYIKFTTAVRTLFKSSAYSSAMDLLIPARIAVTGNDYCIKFKNAVVADGQALTVALDYDLLADDSARTTLVLDMGATDQITFGGQNVALAAAGAEAGDTFDLLVEVRGSGKMDLFYQNKTTGQGALGDADFTTISHACKQGSARAASYTVAYPQYLKMTGTATVESVEVGWQPILLFGDSQSHRTGEGGLTTSATERLGKYLPDAFEYPRIYWPAYISGNRLTAANAANTQSAGYLRYKSASAGVGDLCEMTTPLFCFCGFGVNDVAMIGSTASNRNKVMALFATRVAEILDDLQDRDIPTLVIGLPPYSDGSANAHTAATIKTQVNALLEGLAIGVRASYVNPWHVMCEGGTSEASIPTFASAYTSDAGLHYNATGATVVAGLAAKSVESAIIGGNYGNPYRRRARGHGMLLP